MTETARIGFAELDLSSDMVKTLEGKGFHHPTEVQALVIPRILSGKDLVVQSRTGTGKTLAYGIPLVEKVDPSWKRVQALVLTPTRELALQVKNALQPVAAHRGARVVAVYGGDSMRRQIDDLREPPQIVAATPGRLLDHLGRRTLSLSDCFYMVLDEADEMLSMGFYEEVERIFRHLPNDRQTLLFSATIPQAVLSVAHNYQVEPERISLSDDYVSVREIEHLYVITTEMEKERNLARILEHEDPDSCIIFCNTRDEARRVATYLKNRRFGADLISGELTQRERERVMARIKAGKLKIMVATDVAARGIDVVGLSHVVCFSTSESPEVYIHRTGRTGRVGRPGKAISLVSGRDLYAFNRTEKANGLKIREVNVPTESAIKELRANVMWDRLKAYALEHELDSQDEVSLLVPRILESSEEGKAILYALLKHFFEERKLRETSEPIAVEAPEEGADDYGAAVRALEGRPSSSAPRARTGDDGASSEGGGRKRRRRRRRDDGRGAPDDGPRHSASEGRDERSTEGKDEGQGEAYVVVAVGRSHGATREELERLCQRRGRPLTVTVLEDESILTVPMRAAIALLVTLGEQRLHGQRLMPMQLLGDKSPLPA